MSDYEKYVKAGAEALYAGEGGGYFYADADRVRAVLAAVGNQIVADALEALVSEIDAFAGSHPSAADLYTDGIQYAAALAYCRAAAIRAGEQS